METTINLPHYEGKADKGTFGPGDPVYTKVGNRWMQCRVEAVTSTSAMLTNAGMTPASEIYENPPADSKESNVAELLRRLKITDQNDDERLINSEMGGWALREDTTKGMLNDLWDKAYAAGVATCRQQH